MVGTAVTDLFVVGEERAGRLTFSDDSEQNFSASARYFFSPSSLLATTSADDPSV